MQFGTLYAAGGALVGALAALLVYHAAVVRPALAKAGRLLEVHDELIGGDSGSAAGRLSALEAAAAASHSESLRLGERIGELEGLAATDLSRAGFVRYDAFSGSGAALSYALALLNRDGDGVVLTSIYSRDDTRTYGKPVAGFKPSAQASAEELEAIER
ncbi:MAG: DUF4446 family protein, partial [Candidatus Eremiobacteraeota bacterium]|nr:DUF4446 family protein [Candidatus Eremiobacteraeota bacterium]